ncbi:MAG: NAD-dependent epimerase/dehydratase family protein [Actinomycetes bacterium]
MSLENPLEAFTDKRILVTGGAGLIGSTIIDQILVGSPREIVVLDDFSRGRVANLDSALPTGLVSVIEGDIRDRGAVSSAMAGIDLVYHQAAIRITRCAEEPRVALEVLADGTFNVIEAAVDAGVSRVIAASSASVYGQADQLPTGENHHPWNNDTLYGAAKAFNEGVLQSFRQMRGLDYVALRYFNVYGPRMDIYGVYTEVLVRWMERIEAGEPPLILGDGTQTMDFVHVADIARANVLAASTGHVGETFNVASGSSTSLAELAAMLTNVMGAPDLTPVHGPARATNGVQSRQADITKARDLLGFTAEIMLEAGLRDLVGWWRASPPLDGEQIS